MSTWRGSSPKVSRRGVVVSTKLVEPSVPGAAWTTSPATVRKRPSVMSTWHRKAWWAGVSSASLVKWPKSELRRRMIDSDTESLSHTVVMLKSEVPGFCPKMSLEVAFLRHSSWLILFVVCLVRCGLVVWTLLVSIFQSLILNLTAPRNASVTITRFCYCCFCLHCIPQNITLTFLLRKQFEPHIRQRNK